MIIFPVANLRHTEGLVSVLCNAARTEISCFDELAERQFANRPEFAGCSSLGQWRGVATVLSERCIVIVAKASHRLLN